MPITDDERRALNARAHLLLTGDDGSCFGPDGLQHNERLATAVRDYCRDVFRYGGTMPNSAGWATQPIYKVWDRREGQPWQADIEAHVRAYREPPPDYCGDVALAMKLVDALRETRTVRIQFTRKSAQFTWPCVVWVEQEQGEDIDARGHDDCETITSAYVAVMDASTPRT